MTTRSFARAALQKRSDSREPRLQQSHLSDPAERQASALSRELGLALRPAPTQGRNHPVVSVRAAAPAPMARSAIGSSGDAELDGELAPEADHLVRTSLAGSGVPLDPDLRARIQRSVENPVPDVALHIGAEASRAADAVGARAFTVGHHIAFGASQYAPATHDGSELLAHELTHVLQSPGGNTLHRSPQAPSLVTPPKSDARARAEAIEDAFHGSMFSEDEEKALDQIRNQDPIAVRTIAGEYFKIRKETLQDEFRSYVDAAQFKVAMGWIRPSLSLEERLRLSIDSHLLGLFTTENEGAMLAELNRATNDELTEAAPENSPVRRLLKERLNGAEYYEASRLIDPAHLMEATVAFIKNAPGMFNDDENGTYDVVLRLSVADRRTLWNLHEGLFSFMSDSEKASVRILCLGTETQALKERLRIATSGPGTDDDAVRLVMKQTADAGQRERAISAALASGLDPEGHRLSPEARADLDVRLEELGAVQMNLLTGARDVNGDYDEDSFLEMLHGDVSEGEFRSFAEQIGVSQFERAKQQILDAFHWYSDDEGSVYAAFDKVVGAIDLPPEQLAGLTPQTRAKAQREATSKLRQALLDDKEVSAAIKGHMNADEQAKVATLVSGDSYAIALQKLLQAYEGLDTDEEGIFKILADMSAEQRLRMQKEQPTIYFKLVQEPTSLNKDEQELARTIIETGRIPTQKGLDWAMGGWGDGTKEEMVFQTLERMSDEERTEYRLGYFLYTGGELAIPPGPTEEAERLRQQAAKNKFATLYKRLDAELGTDDLEHALDTLVGSTTLADMASDEGRLIAARLLKERVAARGGYRDQDWLSSFLMDKVSESGGIADDAHVRFLAAYGSAIADGKISPAELAILMSFESEQGEAYQGYVATVDQVSGIAATVAAITVGIVITVASDGLLGPVAAKLIEGAGGAAVVAGVAGAAARVGVHEALAGSHFDALSTEGGADALAGAVDAAFPALTKGLATSLTTGFAGLVGLGGDALAAEATTGVLLASNAALQQAGKRLVLGAFREGIQGLLAGAAGELVLKATDEKTYKQTISRIIESIGEAILHGGGIGAATGAIMGGTLDALTGVVGVSRVRGLVAQLERAGITGKRLGSLPLRSVRALGEVDKLLAGGKLEEAAKLLASLRSGNLEAAEIEGMWKALGTGRGPVPPLDEILPQWQVSAARQAEKALESIAKGLPNHTFEPIGSNVQVNGQLEASAEYLVWLQKNAPEDFEKMLSATKALKDKGGRIADVDESVRAALTKLSATRGGRLRFTFQIGGELDAFLQQTGMADDLVKKFTDLAANVKARARLWEVFRGAITVWKSDASRLAALYALKRAGNLNEFAENMEFFIEYLNREHRKVQMAFKSALKNAPKGADQVAWARKAAGLPPSETVEDAIRAKVLVDAAAADAATAADMTYDTIALVARGHVGVGLVDPALPDSQLVEAARAAGPKFQQTSAAAYHQYKHPEIPDATLLPPGFPNSASDEVKYFALCDHVVKSGATTVKPSQFGGRTIYFETQIGTRNYLAVVHVSPRGEVTLATMFGTK